MSTGTSAPAAGWYPDPVEPGGMRWWSGTGWTAHVSPPVAPAAVAPAVEDDVPDLARFTRDPGARQPVFEEPVVVHRDPYSDRNWLAGLALVVALLSVPGTIVGLFVTLPDIVQYFVSGVPIAVALLGLVASIKLGFSTRMAWLALAISAVTMIAGWAIDAQQFASIPIPGVTDVPGVNQITGLENDNGL